MKEEYYFVILNTIFWMLIVLAIRTVIYQKCLTTASCPSTGYTTLSLLQIEKDVIEFDT